MFASISQGQAYGGQLVSRINEDLGFTYWWGMAIGGVGVFYKYQFIDPAEDWDLPLFFKKGNVEWGVRPTGNGIMGINRLSTLPPISMYPNPSDSHLSVDLSALQNHPFPKLELWDMHGKIRLASPDISWKMVSWVP